MAGPWTYDATLAILPAGRLVVHRLLDQNAEHYELHGEVRTTGVVAAFFRWRGVIAAQGDLVDGQPAGRAYLWIRDDADERTILLSAKGQARRLTVDEDRMFEQPAGSDLMSVIFVSQDCYRGGILNDGRKQYRISLVEQRQDRLTLSRRQRELGVQSSYYLGPALLCDYDTRDEDGVSRRTRVWLGEIGGERLPVKIHVRLPGSPDGTLRLQSPRG
jgi:hypothetical protein